jgi:proteasome lid subunit RPN8/RPN11
MARVVALATELDLQVVGQVHTHPHLAGHSDGDEDGANIKFDGFVSIVVPDYGAHLPSLENSAVYSYHQTLGWRKLPLSAIIILNGGVAL